MFYGITSSLTRSQSPEEMERFRPLVRAAIVTDIALSSLALLAIVYAVLGHYGINMGAALNSLTNQLQQTGLHIVMGTGAALLVLNVVTLLVHKKIRKHVDVLKEEIQDLNAKGEISRTQFTDKDENAAVMGTLPEKIQSENAKITDQKEESSRQIKELEEKKAESETNEKEIEKTLKELETAEKALEELEATLETTFLDHEKRIQELENKELEEKKAESETNESEKALKELDRTFTTLTNSLSNLAKRIQNLESRS